MTGAKYAVCVGINDYPGTGLDLGGCVNDARDWAELLRGQGYRVVTLLDSQATREVVLTELRTAAGAAKYGDRIVFTYSGHGTWVPDNDGDEPDQRDEAMCLHDFQSGGLLLDDDIAQITSTLRRGVGWLNLSDSCFSGTVNRFAALTGAPTTMGTPKFIPPHMLRSDIDEVDAVDIEARTTTKAGSRLTSSLISGCSDLEYSYDAAFDNGRPNGAFTYHAVRTWEPGINLGAWFRRIREHLPTQYTPQTPQLSATDYRKRARAV